ncbi:MAG TPA: hypothetical protein VF074_12080 [Pyrinomonadaceae bacterium]
MKSFGWFLVLFSIATVSIASGQGQHSQIETTYNQDKNLTTVKLPMSRISDDRDRYRSLDFSVFYTYPGRENRVPSDVNFELVSIVKARKLNTDLYVVFVIDGEKIHFSSNRSAIFNPVPGRLWIGERMIFRIPYVTFKKLAAAKHLAIKVGPTNFDLSEDAVASIRRFADTIQE